MDSAPDFRSDKSDSLEGRGIALERWTKFHDAVPDDVWEDIFLARGTNLNVNELSDEARSELSDHVIEHSELLGFWLAWHLAGGFARLEGAGWHRATIHRKIRRFRAIFDQHPDEYRHPWLRLDLEKAWRERLKFLSEPVEEPDY